MINHTLSEIKTKEVKISTKNVNVINIFIAG